MSLVLALLFQAVAAFDARTIPLENKDATVFMGPIENGAGRSVGVQDGSKITVYALQGNSEPRRAVLPVGVTAFDVADLDGDHQAEVIAIAGTQVLRIPLSTAPAAATTLFTCDSVLSGDTGKPYLYPLAWRFSGHTGICLPTSDQVDLYSITGEKTDRFPLQSSGKDASSEDFSSYPFEAEGALAWRVWQRMEFIPALPPGTRAFVGAISGAYNEFIMASRPRGKSPMDWPWFPIRQAGDEILKAHFCLSEDPSGDPRQETSINICSLGAQSPEDEKSGEGALYRYPGILISSWEAPDFNGDGYNDILLGRIPHPGNSISGLVRTLTNGTLPFEATVHLYLPDKRRFDPRPTSLISFPVNVMSFLGGSPAWGIVMRDFNGDGRTDLAVVPNEKQLLVWLYGDRGFSKDPDYSLDSAEPMRKVELVAALENKLKGNKPNWCFGVRTEHSLIVILYSGD